MHRIIAIKYDPYPFERLSSEVKDTYWNLRKNISNKLSSFSHSVHSVMGEGKEAYFWEDQWVGDRPICLTFFHLYHLSFFKNCLVTDILVWSGSLVSFSFGFHHLLYDREVTNVVSLFCLWLGRLILGSGELMLVFGVSTLRKNSLVNLSFVVWWTLLSLGNMSLMFFRGFSSQRKLRFLPNKFYMNELTLGLVFDEVALIGWPVLLYSLLDNEGKLESHSLEMWVREIRVEFSHRVTSDMFVEFFLHLLFCLPPFTFLWERQVLMACWVVCYFGGALVREE